MIGRLRVVTVLTLLMILFLAWRVDQGAQRVGRLEQRLEFQQRQIDGVYCQLDPAPTTAAGARARRDVCGDQP